MARSLNLELILKARDYASRAVQSMAQRTQQANRTITQSAQQGATAQQQAINQTAQVSEQAARVGTMSARRLAQARQGLGVRSEREIQREINRTLAQYNRLKQSGALSYRELARAGEQARNRIRELNAEMGRTPTGQRLGNAVKGVAGVVGGVMAAKHLITPAMNDRKQWNANVSNVALQAFGDKDKAYIQNEGVQQIQQAVVNTVKNVGGVTHDQALDTLNAMMVNGMSFEQANAMLGQATKMQVAGEASSEDIGSLVKTLSDYGFKGEELAAAFQHALRSGMDGKFEIKDMVGALPSLLANAKNAGFSGMGDFDYLLAWLQSAADKSGSNDEAANNVANAINKLTASDTIARLKKMDNPFLKGKGIDFEKSLLDGKARGLNPMQVMSEIADGILAKDKKYQQLQQQAKGATNDEARQQLESQLNLMKGFVLSQLLPDVQAKAGLNAAVDKNAMDNRLANTQNGDLTQGLDEKRFAIASETDLSRQKQAESLAFLGEGVSGGLTSIERSFNDWKIKMAKENPELFATISSLETAFQAVAAGAGVAAVALWGMSGRGNPLDLLRRDPLAGGAGGRSAPQASPRPQAGGGRVAGVGRGAGLLRFGGAALSGLGFLSTTMALGEQQPYQQAQAEMDNEKRASSAKQFAQTQSSSPSVFQYGNAQFAMGQTSKGVPLYGGYALAHLQHDDRVAQARLEMGGYDEATYQARLNRNEQQRQSYLSPQSAPQKGLQAVTNLGNFATSLAELATQPLAMQGQMDSMTTHFGQYHQEIQTLANSLPTAIEAGIKAQSHTIHNQIVVELDGRVVAENTSQYLFNEAKRG